MSVGDEVILLNNEDVRRELLEDVDEYLSALSEQLPGLSISRADAIRQLIAVGLKAEKTRLQKTNE